MVRDGTVDSRRLSRGCRLIGMDRKPEVFVNLMWCVPGAVGGSEEYLVRQLLGLGENEFDVTVAAPKGFAAAHPEIASRHRVTESPHDGRSRPRRVWEESTWLFGQSRSAAVVHHGGGTIPLRHRRPAVLTIHDLQYREFPEYLRAHKLAYLKTVMPRSARRADVIVVPTDFVRRTVVDAYGIDPARILVVPHGIESTLGSQATSADVLRHKYSLGEGPIVVLPAMTHPHKGHDFLFDVMERFWKQQGVTLVLTGGAGLSEDSVNERIGSGGLNGAVRKLGRVSQADRDGLLAMAEALVFPSRYEGFGAPVIEAMVLGTPVICSDRACLPEVVADAGLVLPLEADAWSGAIDEVRQHRDRFALAGTERSKLFTADVSGRALATAYRRAMNRAESK